MRTGELRKYIFILRKLLIVFFFYHQRIPKTFNDLASDNLYIYKKNVIALVKLLLWQMCLTCFVLCILFTQMLHLCFLYVALNQRIGRSIKVPNLATRDSKISA